MEKENLSHSEVHRLFAQKFEDSHDLKIKTRSLHGTKNFTAWEWAITCKAAKDAEGNRYEKKDAPVHKLIGCTLIWWNEKDKIIRNHEYMQVRDFSEDLID